MVQRKRSPSTSRCLIVMQDILSRLAKQRFLLDLRGNSSVADLLREERLQRAIGVIYRPETECMSHYFYTSLPRHYDFMIHISNTEAVTPLNGKVGATAVAPQAEPQNQDLRRHLGQRGQIPGLMFEFHS